MGDKLAKQSTSFNQVMSDSSATELVANYGRARANTVGALTVYLYEAVEALPVIGLTIDVIFTHLSLANFALQAIYPVLRNPLLYHAMIGLEQSFFLLSA